MLLNNKVYFVGILCLLLGFLPCSNVCAQQREIDSLKKMLDKHPQADTTRVIALNALAYNYYTTNLDDLKVYGNQALVLSNQLKYKQGEAVAYKNLGLGYLAANANPQALNYFDKSLTIFISLNDRVNAAKVLNNIGYYYGIIKDHKQELAYFLQAIQKLNGRREQRVMAVILGNIGNSYEAVGKLKEARDYYNQSLKLSIANKLDGDEASAYANLSSVELKEKHYDKALMYCNMVLAMKKNSDNFKPRTLANVYGLLGKIYYQQKNYARARQALQQSATIANKIGNVEQIQSNYYDFYLLDSAKGDYRSAFNNYYQYSKLNDSIISVDKNRVVALYQIRYDSQRRLDENQRLRVEDEKNQAVINQQRIIQIILIMGIIIICGGAIYLKYIYDEVKAKSNIINEQNRVLEANNLVKDKLFSVISHDLRSPITQVIGLLNLLDDGELTMKEMAELTPAVKSSIGNTLELLDNLLIWSKEQLQGFHLNREPFNLYQLANESIAALNSSIQQKQLDVTNNVLPETVIDADREMIQIVLRNLISNAVKFTNPKGSINVASSIENDCTVICVTDTGIGIKEADMEKIFSFTSHTTLGTANEKGTGIGLKICKDFIELNNGRIWAESKEGVGSKFCIAVPVNASR
ncbi:ATP-binding protein [Mucilaginibacter sp. AW1-3]